MEIMESAKTVTGTNQFLAARSSLPQSRDLWPTEARKAFGGVLSDLNGWCRQFDWPINGNVRVAEEAVRRSWAA
jgi:hypothetical protein